MPGDFGVISGERFDNFAGARSTAIKQREICSRSWRGHPPPPGKKELIKFRLQPISSNRSTLPWKQNKETPTPAPR